MLRWREVRLAKTALKFVWPKCNSGHPARTYRAAALHSDRPNYQNVKEHTMNISDF